MSQSQNVFQYQGVVEVLSTSAETVSVDKWYVQHHNPPLPLAARGLPGWYCTTFTPVLPSEPAPDIPHFQCPTPIWVRRPNTHQYQVYEFKPVIPDEDVTVDKWFIQQLPPVRLKQIVPEGQRVMPLHPPLFALVDVLLAAWWIPPQPPVRRLPGEYIRPLHPSLTVEPIDPNDKWFVPASIPVIAPRMLPIGGYVQPLEPSLLTLTDVLFAAWWMQPSEPVRLEPLAQQGWLCTVYDTPPDRVYEQTVYRRITERDETVYRRNTGADQTVYRRITDGT